MPKLEETAGLAFQALQSAILNFVVLNPEGSRNDQVAKALGLETSYNGGQRNYLTFSILSGLVENGSISRTKVGKHVYYKPIAKSE